MMRYSAATTKLSAFTARFSTRTRRNHSMIRSISNKVRGPLLIRGAKLPLWGLLGHEQRRRPRMRDADKRRDSVLARARCEGAQARRRAHRARHRRRHRVYSRVAQPLGSMPSFRNEESCLGGVGIRWLLCGGMFGISGWPSRGCGYGRVRGESSRRRSGRRRLVCRHGGWRSRSHGSDRCRRERREFGRRRWPRRWRWRICRHPD